MRLLLFKVNLPTGMGQMDIPTAASSVETAQKISESLADFCASDLQFRGL
jgi:hypothetical protein